jgi:hypothetical protein
MMMPSPAASPPPEVFASPLDAVSEHWGSTSIPVGWTLLGLGLIVLAVGGVATVRWVRRRHERPRPLAVFGQLARLAGLSLGDQWLLWRIARQQALPGPATLLLSTRTLRVHGVAFVRQAAIWRRGARLRRVATIRRRLLSGAAISE